MSKKFVLCRIINMRGVNLNQFDFDYDLTWMGFFMNAEGKVYGRYGGRDDHDAERHLSLSGLKYAMKQALYAHRIAPGKKSDIKLLPSRRAEQLPAANRIKKDSCIHCHQVRGFQHQKLRNTGKWTRDQIWVYPSPKNVGLILDKQQGDLVEKVVPQSAAAKAGLKKGDRLISLDSKPIASFADAQYALHKAGNQLTLKVAWQRNRELLNAKLTLKKGWREGDISWRASMWGLQPQAHVYGKDLTAGEKKRVGLSPNSLAFRQGKFVPNPTRNAGIRGGDIIVGIDGKKMELTMLKFNVFIRLNYKVGDQIVYDVIRGKKKLKIPFTLTKKKAW